MKTSFKSPIYLKQHTPIIHFQHDQDGAMLRATEVKPKLDKYLLEKEFGNDKEMYGQYLIGGARSEHKALNYKLKITGEIKTVKVIEEKSREFPMFFANMGDDYKERGLVFYKDRIRVDIHSYNKDLLAKIHEHLGAFFTCTNFGMRSTKGYGSFTVEDDGSLPPNAYYFDLNTNDWNAAFQKIDWFYKSIRGGINDVRQTDRSNPKEQFFYMKPLIFWYAQQHNIKWEKKIIKESKNFESYLISHQEKHDDKVDDAEKREWPLWNNEPNKRIVRDLLGLSTEQSWKGYSGGRNGATITKVDVNGKIDRFPSPLIFKPVRIGNTFRVYFWANSIPPEYLKSKFKIEANKSLIGEINMWEDFNIHHFLETFLTVENAEAAMNYNPDNDRQVKTAQTLLNIYENINKVE